jgi:hypothetical protein
MDTIARTIATVTPLFVAGIWYAAAPRTGPYRSCPDGARPMTPTEAAILAPLLLEDGETLAILSSGPRTNVCTAAFGVDAAGRHRVLPIRVHDSARSCFRIGRGRS